MQKTPVHRPVIKDAVLFSWHHPKLWVLGTLSAILFTGGTMDLLFRFWHDVSNRALSLSAVQQSNSNPFAIFQLISLRWFGGHFLNAPLFNTLFIIGILGLFLLSCVAQGMLVLTFHESNSQRAWRSLFQISIQHLPSIAKLNLFTVLIFWIARMGTVLPFSVTLCDNCPLLFLQYLLSFFIFFLIVILLSVLHLFTLNNILFINKELLHSLLSGWKRIKKHWLLIFETIFFQSVLHLFFSALALLISLFLSIPAIALFTYAFIEKNAFAFKAGSFYVGLLLVLLLILTIGFLTTFQYAIWSFMYHRMTNTYPIPKLKRLSRILNLSI